MVKKVEKKEDEELAFTIFFCTGALCLAISSELMAFFVGAVMVFTATAYLFRKDQGDD